MNEELTNAQRAAKTRKVLDDLIDIAEGWESEIQNALSGLDADEAAEFLQGAAHGADILSGFVANMLIRARVQLPMRAPTATGGTR
jgi:phytoene/squalene synthetase